MKKVQALLMVTALAVAGCGGQQQANKESAKPSSTFTTVDTGPSPDPLTTPTNTPPAVEETTAPPEEPGIAKVGPTEWFDYEDGLRVQVTKLARFKIGQNAAGGKPGGTGVIVTVTIKNGTKTTFDTSSISINVTSGPNGDTAESVYDTDKGLSGGFEGSIPPNRVKTAKAGFAVPLAHMKDIQIEIAPDYDHESSFFEGAAK